MTIPLANITQQSVTICIKAWWLVSPRQEINIIIYIYYELLYLFLLFTTIIIILSARALKEVRKQAISNHDTVCAQL